MLRSLGVFLRQDFAETKLLRAPSACRRGKARTSGHRRMMGARKSRVCPELSAGLSRRNYDCSSEIVYSRPPGQTWPCWEVGNIWICNREVAGMNCLLAGELPQQSRRGSELSGEKRASGEQLRAKRVKNLFPPRAQHETSGAVFYSGASQFVFTPVGHLA